MKKLHLLILLLIACNGIWAQNNVGIGTPTPRPKAILDLTATDKGFLMPRINVPTPSQANLNALFPGLSSPRR